MKERLRRLLSLFGVFFKIGAFTFGGGYAMIPLVQREIAEKRGWIEEGDILDIVAIAESTPGPIAINSATFVGYKVGGFWGAVAATIGVIVPSFAVIAVIAHVLRQFESLEVVKYAFNGVRAAVLALIVKALVSMYKQCSKNLFSYIVMGAVFVLAAFLDVNVLLIVIGCALAGIVFSMIAQRRMKA